MRSIAEMVLKCPKENGTEKKGTEDSIMNMIVEMKSKKGRYHEKRNAKWKPSDSIALESIRESRQHRHRHHWERSRRKGWRFYDSANTRPMWTIKAACISSDRDI